MPGFLSPGKGVPLLLIPEYSGINKDQRIPDRSKTAHRKPSVKCFLTNNHNNFRIFMTLITYFLSINSHFPSLLTLPPHPEVLSNHKSFFFIRLPNLNILHKAELEKKNMYCIIIPIKIYLIYPGESQGRWNLVGCHL